MTVQSHRSDAVRHLVVRLSNETSLVDALARALGESAVACGWLRASGVLEDVELRVLAASPDAPPRTIRLEGRVLLVALDAPIGPPSDHRAPFSLRATVAPARTDASGSISGEIVDARCIALEGIVTVLDDLRLERVVDPATGLRLFELELPAPSASPKGAAAPPAAAAGAWRSAVSASENRERLSPTHARSTGDASPQGPLRPPKAARPDEPDAPTPEAGDVVDHFAFGRCDVLKSDGDRLHLRVAKDGRVREIALEMLRVSLQDEEDGGRRRFNLERRI